MKLNPKQIKAVKHKSGPLLIVAGAGTGKTTVITERIKHLITKKKVDPQHIFAVTFTQKSAYEMTERLDKVMPLGYQEPWLGTFHSVCDKLLRLESLEVGINPNFTIMTQTDQWIFIKKHLFEFNLDYYRPLGNPNKFISALIQFFSRLQDEDISDSDFAKFTLQKRKTTKSAEEKIEASRLIELSQAFKKYNLLKFEHTVSDFGDLIQNTLRLFRARPNILEKYQQMFRHFLVDEFQDTNYAQYQLIKLLAPADNNPQLIVVGDDDQSIYKFRGAAISNILEFREDYPKSKLVVLSDNYRSTQSILSNAYQSIIHNNPDRLEEKLNINKKLKSKIAKDNKPQTISFANIEQEIDWTIKNIINLVAKENINYQDIAILTRSNSQLDHYVRALKVSGLPYQRVSNRGLFDQNEIKDLIDLIKVISDPTDSMALFSVSLSHIASIKSKVALHLISQAKKKSVSLWRIYTQSTDSNVMHLVSMIKKFQQKVDQLSVSQILFEFINTTHYLEPYIKEDTIENQLAINNINLFFTKLSRFERTSTSNNIINFLDTLELWLEAGENPGQAQIEDIDTISLMTVHAAKGLEFEAIFIGGLISGWFPSRNRKDPITLPEELVKETLPTGDEHIQEERRLFYVALTRAKTHLYCTYSEDVGGVRKRKASGFLEETNIEKISLPPISPQFTSETSHKAKPTYLKKGKFQINKLSYSQIDTFTVCPLKYKYRYLLQIPAKPHHSLSFGRTMHQTLHQFHQLEMTGKEVGKQTILDLYKENFIEEGYDSEELKLERFKAGSNALLTYLKKYKKVLHQPILLEQPFSLTLLGTKLVGKIDRIDEKEDGSLEIIDYKTGRIKDQKQVDKDEQLTIYSLAAKVALGLDIKSSSLYFLEGGGEKISTTRSESDLSKAKKKIERQINTIKKSDFPPKPNKVKCGFCEYSSICPFAL